MAPAESKFGISVHGFQHLINRQSGDTFNDNNKFYIVSWIVALTVTLVLLVLQLMRLVSFYLSWPTAVSIMITSHASLNFPAVTACSSGIVNKNVVGKIPTFMQMEAALSTVKTNSRQKRSIEVLEPQNIKKINFTSCEEKDFQHAAIRTKRSTTPYECDGFCDTSINIGGLSPCPTQADCKTKCDSVHCLSYTYNSGCGTSCRIYSGNCCTDPGRQLPTPGGGCTDYVYGYAQCDAIVSSTGSLTSSGPFVQDMTYTFQCNTGYFTATGGTQNTYLCTSTGNWDKVFTPCTAHCDAIVNTTGSLTSNGPYVQDMTYTFQCNTGYFTATGGTQNTYLCTSTRNWDKVLAPCIASCQALDLSRLGPMLTTSYNPANTSVIYSGTVATFGCANNFTMYGNTNTKCVDGSWNVSQSDYPICLGEPVPFYDETTFLSSMDTNTMGDKIAASATLVDILPYIWANLSSATRDSMGFSQSDIIMGCTFNNRPCETNEVHSVQDPTSGNCYTFNHEFMSNQLQVYRVGQDHGLYWLFDAKQADFISVVPTAGIQIIIHQQNEPTFSDTMGFTASPGFVYNVQLKRQTEVKYSTPNSRCIDNPMDTKYYFFANRTYTSEACIRSRMQSRFILNCGCAAPYLPYYNSNSTICNLEKRSCIMAFLGNLTVDDQNKLQSWCPPSCTSKMEKNVITTTVTVPDAYLFSHLNRTETYVRNNIVGVQVYYSTMLITEFQENLAYTVFNLLSDIGSSMGLLLGMSVVSGVELLFIVVRITAVLNFSVTKSLRNHFKSAGQTQIGPVDSKGM